MTLKMPWTPPNLKTDKKGQSSNPPKINMINTSLVLATFSNKVIHMIDIPPVLATFSNKLINMINILIRSST